MQTSISFIRDNAQWAPLIAFLLAFGESLVFLSLLLPATAILFAVGFMIGAAELDFFIIWLSAAFGAFMGDWLSYWFGKYFQNKAFQFWPLSRNPKIIENGTLFFRRWGTWSVFIGRFFGPLRAVIPLLAGIFGLPHVLFQLANATSAAVWAFVMLAPGSFAMQSEWITHWLNL